MQEGMNTLMGCTMTALKNKIRPPDSVSEAASEADMHPKRSVSWSKSVSYVQALKGANTRRNRYNLFII
jgi:hypothetical protein